MHLYAWKEKQRLTQYNRNAALIFAELANRILSHKVFRKFTLIHIFIPFIFLLFHILSLSLSPFLLLLSERSEHPKKKNSWHRVADDIKVINKVETVKRQFWHVFILLSNMFWKLVHIHTGARARAQFLCVHWVKWILAMVHHRHLKSYYIPTLNARYWHVFLTVTQVGWTFYEQINIILLYMFMYYICVQLAWKTNISTMFVIVSNGY